MNEKQYNSEDQINLGAFKQLVIGMLREFFRFVAFTQQVIRRKIWFMVAGALVGILCALYIYYKRPNVFQATMVVKYRELSRNTFGEVLNQLNRLIATGASDKVAEELRVPPHYVNGLLFIEGKNLSNLDLVRDTTTRQFPTFKINIRFLDSAAFLDNSIADTLTNSLVAWLNNRPYLKQLEEVERQNSLERLKFIERDLAKLDSLKTGINRFIEQSKGPTTVYNNAMNPAEIYEQGISLQMQRERTLRQLELDLSSVVLVDGFKITEVPRSKSLPDLLLILGILGSFTGFLVGLLLETKKRILPE